jgi:hypothetical protein
MTTATRKPCQQYRPGFLLKDGRVFLARCWPIFYGTVTPGFAIDEDGKPEFGEFGACDYDISNDEMVDPKTSAGQWGQVAYYQGNPVGLSSNARPRTDRERKQKVRVTLYHIAPDAYVLLTRTEFNRKVKFRWEKV